MDPAETIREVQRELGDVMLGLDAGTVETKILARRLDRSSEELAEAADALRTAS